MQLGLVGSGQKLRFHAVLSRFDAQRLPTWHRSGNVLNVASFRRALPTFVERASAGILDLQVQPLPDLRCRDVRLFLERVMTEDRKQGQNRGQSAQERIQQDQELLDSTRRPQTATEPRQQDARNEQIHDGDDLPVDNDDDQ